MYCNKVPSHRLCVTHGYEESEPGMCNYILEGTALDLRPKVVAERLEGVLHIKSWDEVSVLRMCSEKERGSIIRNVVFSLLETYYCSVERHIQYYHFVSVVRRSSQYQPFSHILSQVCKMERGRAAGKRKRAVDDASSLDIYLYQEYVLMLRRMSRKMKVPEMLQLWRRER